jgi:predicted alpha/beta-fold hydrolase
MNPAKAAQAPVVRLPFRPLPFLGNAHVQTVLGTLWEGKIPPLQSRVRLIDLAEGDRLLAYDSVPAGWRPSHWAAVLVHGMGGSYRSGSIRRLATALLGHGFRVVRVNLCGAASSWKLTRRLYHAGCSGDIRAALADLARNAPGVPLVLIGLSLGGNIVLKLAGEASLDAVSGLAGVATLSAPIDLVRSSELISGPGNRLYERYYLRTLVRTARRHQAYFPDLPPVTFPGRLTLRQFDDLHTAPRGGFADALDYYRRSSALPWVPRIRVPAVLLTARDDPFIAADAYDELPRHPLQEVRVVDQGGHLGFLGDDGAGGIRWGERRIVEWVTHLRAAAANGGATHS